MTLAAGDYVLVATGLGDSVQQARNKAYRILEKIKIPASPFWRPDIGSRLKKQLPEVQKHGYATGMTF
jgi:phosphoribosylamine--glycine ligase